MSILSPPLIIPSSILPLPVFTRFGFLIFHFAESFIRRKGAVLRPLFMSAQFLVCSSLDAAPATPSLISFSLTSSRPVPPFSLFIDVWKPSALFLSPSQYPPVVGVPVFQFWQSITFDLRGVSVTAVIFSLRRPLVW